MCPSAEQIHAQSSADTSNFFDYRQEQLHVIRDHAQCWCFDVEISPASAKFIERAVHSGHAVSWRHVNQPSQVFQSW